VTIVDLHRQAVGIEPPSGDAARRFAGRRRTNFRAQPWRFDQLGDDMGVRRGTSPTQRRDRWRLGDEPTTAEERQVILDVLDLLHAAFGPGLTPWYTPQRARAMRRLLYALTDAGLPRPSTWAELQDLIDTHLRGPDRPRPQQPGTALEDVLSLLAAVEAAKIAVGHRPVRLTDLRAYWRPRVATTEGGTPLGRP
jgi:hypothetical protein